MVVVHVQAQQDALADPLTDVVVPERSEAAPLLVRRDRERLAALV